MSTVRAQNQQDLIYKRGQAGVTKASVTIVFDNSEKDKSPIGFEDQQKISVTRQIVLGGTSKFLINGHRAQQQSVQQLFQSVQLNINNPNFLIMQGRITKVLNMKPPEILALIEEAAGTRMFEERREKAIKTMTKKQSKVTEIHALLEEEIEPKLENLRNEKRMFLEYQQTRSSLERMEKLVGAYDYTRYSRILEGHESGLDSKRKELSTISDQSERAQFEINNLSEEIRILRARKEQQIQKGGNFERLESAYKEVSQKVARTKTLLEIKASNIREEQSSTAETEQLIQSVSQSAKEKLALFEEIKAEYEKIKLELEQMDTEIANKEELLQSLQTGVSSKAGEEGGYSSALQNARTRANHAKTSSAQAEVRIKYLQKLISDDQPKTEKAERQNSATLKELESANIELTSLKDQMAQAGWVPGKLEELKTRESQLLEEIRNLESNIDDMRRQVSNIDFHYSKPSASFNAKSVKGLVAQLFSLEEKEYQKATAIEVTAGGRLYQVVVDSDITASQLLKGGQLRRRVTIIPLNKINSYKLSSDRVSVATKLAPGKVNLALDLIGYEQEVSKAMEYVFGSTLVCADAETAKKVTFNPAVRAKTVTLEGDIYDPNGTLSGGSSRNSGKANDSLVIRLQRYNSMTKKLRRLKDDFRDIQRQIDEEQSLMERCKDLKKLMDLKQHEVSIMKKRINDSPSAALIAKRDERLEEVANLQGQIQQYSVEAVEAENQVAQIEADMNEFKNNRGGKLEAMKKELDIIRKTRMSLSQALKERFNGYQTSRVESEQLSSEVIQLTEQVAEKTTSIKDMHSQHESLKKELEDAQLQEADAYQALEEEKSSLLGIDDELQTMDALLNQKKGLISEYGLQMQRLNHDIEQMSKDSQQAVELLQHLETKYEWIQEQKQFFGVAGTPYAFEEVNIKECRHSLKALEQTAESMKKNVNPKVMNMIESVEKKEHGLQQMIKTIEKDKSKIEETIVSLDEYKRKALEKTWLKVSDDFGKIFGDLLPNSFAKLVPPEGQEVTQGLEVKVSLGGVWKDGLAELSGGQRSLIALSLILALLQFKPAPMYILDEVDAALDLHHTQNIGHIIKTRFKGSQFIVVSLKEGMFTNANRVFRARFQEGTSTVSVM